MYLKHYFSNTGFRISMLSVALLIVLSIYGFRVSPDDAEQGGTTTKPTWVDLVTPNLEKTQSFYKSLFGWTYLETTVNGVNVALIKKQDVAIGSIIEIKKAKASVWMPAASVSMSDLKTMTEKLIANGAKKAFGPIQYSDRGTQVLFEGAQGEEFSLISGNPFEAKNVRTKDDGTFMGSELWADNVNDASRFYQYAFSVQVEQENFSGKPYWFLEKQGKRIAGMINNPITNQSSQWVTYIYSANPEMLSRKIESLGGTVIAAPTSALRNGKVAVVQDPYGAIFCIHSNK